MSVVRRFLFSVCIALFIFAPVLAKPDSAAAYQGTLTPTPCGSVGGPACPTDEPPTSTSTPFPIAGPPTSTATPFDLRLPIPSEANPYQTPPPPFGALPTYTPTPTVVFAAPDVKLPDLEVYAIEVTQGIQDLENRMPLVTHRGTVIRVYTRTDGGTLTGVRGAIEAYRDGQLLPGGPIFASNGPITSRASGPDRLVVDDTLNFFVPNSWREGTVTYRVYVYSVHPNWPYWYEPSAANNYFQVTVEYEQKISLNVVFSTMHLHKFDENGIDFNQFADYVWDANAARLAAYIMQFYPVTDLIPISDSFPVIWPKDHPALGHAKDWTLVENKDASAMLSRIQWTRDNSGWLTNEFWYGMISPDLPWYWTIPPKDGGGTFTAWGMSNGTVAMGKMFNTWDADFPWFLHGEATLAHEGGHNYGLLHYSCTGTEQLGGSVGFYPYPAPNCSLAEIDPEGFYGYVWYYHVWDHMSAPIVISNDPAAGPPNQAFPLMGYQGPQYSDPYTYCVLLDYFGVDCSPSQLGIPEASTGQVAGLGWLPPSRAELRLPVYLQSVPEYLLVDGVIDLANDDATFDHVLRTTDVEDSALDSAMRREAHRHGHAHHAETEFNLSLEAADGTVLFTLPLVNFGISTHVPPPNYPFTELVPFADGTYFIRIRQGDFIRDERIVSANAPVVALLTQNEGGPLVAPVEIRWQASDADGDPLTYMLQYSPDGGESWQLLESDIVETAVRLTDLALLPGSDNGFFRVTVMDGVNTGSALNAAPFSVPNNPPSVSIVSPSPQTNVETNGLVHFLGSAYDMEDRGVAPEAMVWTSDRDGQLGTGTSFELTTLSPGLHKVTLTATDSQGLEASTFTFVTVDGGVVRPVPDEAEIAMVVDILAGNEPAPPPADGASEPDAAAGVDTIWFVLAAVALLGGLLLYFRSRK